MCGSPRHALVLRRKTSALLERCARPVHSGRAERESASHGGVASGRANLSGKISDFIQNEVAVFLKLLVNSVGEEIGEICEQPLLVLHEDV